MTVRGHLCRAALLLEGQQSSVWALEVPADQGDHRHSSRQWGSSPLGPQVSVGELEASCGRQRRSLRTDLSSSCRTGAPHVTQNRSRVKSLSTTTVSSAWGGWAAHSHHLRGSAGAGTLGGAPFVP